MSQPATGVVQARPYRSGREVQALRDLPVGPALQVVQQNYLPILLGKLREGRLKPAAKFFPLDRVRW